MALLAGETSDGGNLNSVGEKHKKGGPCRSSVQKAAEGRHACARSDRMRVNICLPAEGSIKYTRRGEYDRLSADK